MNDDGKRVLTSGEVAAYCNVHFRTVIRWIEKGRLKAYKLPGRGNNRIELQDFLNFLDENQMPVPYALKVSDSKKVLIVDDDVNMAKAIQRVLKVEGYETYLAHDGFQAGVLLTQVQPKLMTLDLNMPGMNGFSVLEFIKDANTFPQLKIVVISAQGQHELDKARENGAHRCLSKPFSNEELLSVVEDVLV